MSKPPDHTVIGWASSDGQSGESITYYRDVKHPAYLPLAALCPETIDEWATWHHAATDRKIDLPGRKRKRHAEIAQMAEEAKEQWYSKRPWEVARARQKAARRTCPGGVINCRCTTLPVLRT
jgi:hypothetical protein